MARSDGWGPSAAFPTVAGAYHSATLLKDTGVRGRGGREVTDYAVVLMLRRGQATETVRVYDGAHGHNEMHRYGRRGGKQPGTRFHGGTLGEGMRAAIDEVETGYREMIEGWEAR